MELCLNLIEQIIYLVLMAMGGFFLGKAKLITSEECRALSVLSVYLLTPCMLLRSFLMDWTTQKRSGILLALAAAAAVYALFFLLTFLLRKLMPLSEIDAASLIYTNAGNILIPLVAGTLGVEYVFYASGYMVVQNLLMWTYGVRAIGKQRSPQFRRILTNPALLAIGIGFLYMMLPIPLPPVLREAVDGIGACLAPISMILIGILFAGIDKNSGKHMAGIARITALRLLGYPAVALVFLSVFSRFLNHPDSKNILFVILLASCAPSAAQVPQVAQMFDNEADRASCINVTTTLMCVVTFPIFTLLAQICFA